MMKGVWRPERDSPEQQDSLEYLLSMRRGRDCHADHHHHHDEVGLFDPKEKNEMDRRQRQKCRGEDEDHCHHNSSV